MSISPDPIFQMLTGFWVSKTLMAAVEVDIFPKVEGRQVTAQELRQLLCMEERPAQSFAAALVSLGLLEHKTGRFSNSALASAFLVRQKPGYMGGFIRMVDGRVYSAWGQLSWSLANNRPVEAKSGGDAESLFDDAKQEKGIHEIEKFTHAMYGVSIGPAMALAKAFDFAKHKSLLDIGGGSGVYSIWVAKENPNMTATVADLAPVCRVAEQYIASYGLAGRIKTIPLDFWKQDIPAGYDVMFLSHILHDYSEERGTTLLKKVYAALPKGGVVIMLLLMTYVIMPSVTRLLRPWLSKNKLF